MQKFGYMVLGLVAFTSLSAAQAGPIDPHTVVVNGEAEILVSPDHATIDIGVITSDKVTTRALQANNVEMQQVVAAIKAVGIPESAMQTSEFSISAMHPKSKGDYEADESVALGYQVSNKLTISVTDLKKVADIIDAAVKAGANSSNSVRFDLKNRAAVDDEALAAAVRAARHKAETMTSAEHAKVGKMISMTTEDGGFSNVLGADGNTVTVTASRLSILPGQISIMANVVVTYAIE